MNDEASSSGGAAKKKKRNNNKTNHQTKKKTTTTIPQWREAVAGACAGIVSRTAMAPLERIKLLKQLQTTTTTSTTSTTTILPRNQTSWTILYRVYHEQGFLSFWRGNLPGALRVGGTASINFTCLDYYKKAVVGPLLQQQQQQQQQQERFLSENNNNNRKENEERYQKFVTSFVAGGLAGATSTTIMYPFEFARTRLALDMGKDHPPPSSPAPVASSSVNNNNNNNNNTARQYKGTADVVAQIVRSDGIFGLYRGYGIALVGGIFYRVLYLGGYDALKSELEHHHKQQFNQKKMVSSHGDDDDSDQNGMISWNHRFLAAQSVSLLAGTLSYPLDSVRRRMMMQSGTSPDKRQYKTSLDCIQKMWRKEGIRGFYLGLAPNLARSIGGAILLVAYDVVRTLL